MRHNWRKEDVALYRSSAVSKAEWFGYVLEALVYVRAGREQCERVGEVLAEWEHPGDASQAGGPR